MTGRTWRAAWNDTAPLLLRGTAISASALFADVSDDSPRFGVRRHHLHGDTQRLQHQQHRASHTYAAAGVYTVTLTLTDPTDNLSATSTFQYVVICELLPCDDPFAGANAYALTGSSVRQQQNGTTLHGPIALVLVGLPSDVTLTNADGYDSYGNPYIDIGPG